MKAKGRGRERDARGTTTRRKEDSFGEREGRKEIVSMSWLEVREGRFEREEFDGLDRNQRWWLELMKTAEEGGRGTSGGR